MWLAQSVCKRDQALCRDIADTSKCGREIEPNAGRAYRLDSRISDIMLEFLLISLVQQASHVYNET